MWNRAEVKAKGKEAFKRNYWMSVLVGFVYMVFFASTSAGSAATQKTAEGENALTDLLNGPNAEAVIMMILMIIGVSSIISAVVNIFLFNPLEVGCNRFFMVNQYENASLNELGHGFKINYLHVALGILLRDLIVGVGILLCVIPGIIAAYFLRMVPYILAEDENISCIDAMKRSFSMMKGNCIKSFVFDLSFIGWFLLEAVTCGLVGIFYVNPYKFNADAALYQAIKAEYRG